MERRQLAAAQASALAISALGILTVTCGSRPPDGGRPRAPIIASRGEAVTSAPALTRKHEV